MTAGRDVGRPIDPPRTSLLSTDASEVEYLVTRAGEPVSVYAHGLLSSITQARIWASGVPGTAAFFHFRGHGRTRALDGRWDYGVLAEEFRAVADHVSATRAVGVSLGAGALLRLLAGAPRRFDRVVLALPAAVDIGRAPGSREVWRTLAARVADADAAGVARALLAAQPKAVRTLDAARQHCAAAAAALVDGGRTEQTATAVRQLPQAAPVAEGAALRQVDVPVLVICQPDDPLHPVQVGEELADLLPDAQLRVLDLPGAPWFGRAELRAALADFLGA